MIAPLTPLSISGVLWFQGEENAAENRNQCGSCSYGGGPRYACLMQAMIESWREAWVTKDFPFAMVQLAAYYSSGADINAIRIAQAMATDLTTQTGMALAIDHGDPTAPLGPVHSRDKEPVARRLAATMFRLRGCPSDCAAGGGSCKLPSCGAHAEGAILPSGEVLRANGPRLTSSVLSSFAGNVSIVQLHFNHSTGLRFANTSLCNISQPVGSGKRRRHCCAALPDTMRLCLGGTGAANAPFDLNTSSCFGLDEITADATTGTVHMRATTPGPAGWVQWSADPYPECALLNDAGLPASPFAAKLESATGNAEPLKTESGDGAAAELTVRRGV